MKKLLKAILNMFIIFVLVSIFPIVLFIDVIRVHFAYWF